MRFVSVIIPTYNRGKLLPNTLDSFLSQDYPRDRYEIIIANNNSTDDTQPVIHEYCSKNPQITALLEKRQGVHYARNSAAKIAKGDILYFTDDDMVADPSLITEIVKVFDLDPLIGSATGKIIGNFEVPPPRWVKKHLMNRYLSLTENNTPEGIVVSRKDIVYSCHEAIRKDVFFECGGFNPENTAGVWIGDGETGLGIKMKKAGYIFAYTSRSVIYHLIPKSRMTLQYLIKRVGNQAFSDSYTVYRIHRNRAAILFLMLLRNTLGLIILLAMVTAKLLLRIESWHFIPAWAVYAWNWNKYDLKLYFNADFRNLVEIDDWVHNDQKVNITLD